MAKYLLTLVVIMLTAGVYCAYAFWAYHPSDDGVVLGMAWRVASGEVPHRDFISMRPPLSAYLHSLWLLLPVGMQFLAARLGFYLQMSLTLLLPVWWALGKGLLRVSTASGCLVVTFWFLAIHIFPPMPWPTVDGVMFGYLGLACWLWAISHSTGQAKGVGLRFAAGLFFSLAALCKQNFIVLPAWFLGCSAMEMICLWHQQGRLSGRLVYNAMAALISVALTTAVFVWLLHAGGALDHFYEQVIGAHVHRYLGKFGFATYIPGRRFLLLAATALVAVILAYRFLPRTRRYWPLVIMAGSFLALAGWVVHSLFIYPDPYHVVAMGAKWVLWLVAGASGWVLYQMRRSGDPEFWPVAVLGSGVVLLGWSASISMGWNTPLLGLGGGGVLLAMAHDRIALARISRRVVAIMAIGCAVAVAGSFSIFNYQRPYMDQKRSELTHDLGEIFGRFGVLYTNADNHARHAELAALSDDLTRRYPRARLAVVGEFPLYNYLRGASNPTSIDWWNPWEYIGFEGRLQRELQQPGLLIILDCVRNDKNCGCYPAGRDRDKMRAWIRKQFPLLTQGGYFCVFGRPPESGPR